MGISDPSGQRDSKDRNAAASRLFQKSGIMNFETVPIPRLEQLGPLDEFQEPLYQM
jgi:hypothetical protein